MTIKTFHSSNISTNCLRLRDGRTLGYAEHGDLSGKPIILFHGTPGSRLFRHPDESIASSLGARIITVDRPGFGLSDFKGDRRLLDWPDDVLQLADALGVDRFAVLGYSGGGPYAAACAFMMPSRLTAIALVSSMAPLDIPNATDGMMLRLQLLFDRARESEIIAALFLRLAALFYNHAPERLFGLHADVSPGSGNPVIDWSGIRAMLVEDLGEALRNGTMGAALELNLLSLPWGFELENIRTHTYLWHGEADSNVPVVMGKYLAKAIPNCDAVFVPGQGHELIYLRWGEILSTLISCHPVPIAPGAFATNRPFSLQHT